MHIHILGIAGTFMGSLALLAKELGYKVSGQDMHIYPPMSTQLENLDIPLEISYDVTDNLHNADCIIIGNALSRGVTAVEYILNHNLEYTSGAQWLSEHVLKDKWVLAVSGTHGKTTTTSMLAWILEYAGLHPGFLIGGIAENFSVSARLGKTPFFVIEADEYDTAFFDKRSKFIHYHPKTLVINNIEYDHADIFPNINSIIQQFHYLIRTIPEQALILAPNNNDIIEKLFTKGVWTPIEYFSALPQQKSWSAKKITQDGSQFKIYFSEQLQGKISWNLIGDHNIANAISAIAAARHAGVPTKYAITALSEFKNVKKRLEVKGCVRGITVYDDFAHHPTAIKTTLAGLRKKVQDKRIIAILEPRSNSMKMGVHNTELVKALDIADQVFLFIPLELTERFSKVLEELGSKADSFSDIEQLIDKIIAFSQTGDQLLIMSNGGFAGIHERLLKIL